MPEFKLPPALQFDTDDITKFGQQVATMLGLKPDDWRVMPDLSAFSHPVFGEFHFDETARLRHAGARIDLGAAIPPGKQRALTRGDQTLIVDALAALLVRPIDYDAEVAREREIAAARGSLFAAPNPNVLSQQQAMMHAMQATKLLRDTPPAPIAGQTLGTEGTRLSRLLASKPVG